MTNILSTLALAPSRTLSLIPKAGAATASMPRALLTMLFPPGRYGVLRFLAILLILVNIKSLPLMWHGRFYAALYHHLFRNRTTYPAPGHLFAPISTLSRPSLYECDVNMHKSNSTYFSDLDINRTHLIAHLIKRSLQLRRARNEKPMYVALAGVTALFRREIKPFEKYEMRSRVLAWDGKWLFVVSHFVKVGGGDHAAARRRGEEPDMTKRIYASCLSKYVCKVGRKTVPPEEVLTESGLIPQRPEGVPPPDYAAEGGAGVQCSGSVSPAGLYTNTPDLVAIGGGTLSAASAGGKYEDLLDRVLEKSLAANASAEEAANGSWSWQRIERERRRGMEIARVMLGLDRLDLEVREPEAWGKLH